MENGRSLTHAGDNLFRESELYRARHSQNQKYDSALGIYIAVITLMINLDFRFKLQVLARGEEYEWRVIKFITIAKYVELA